MLGKPDNVIKPSNGLASVYKHIQEKFGDKIKFCAYKVSDDNYMDRWIKPFIRETYGAKDVPAILFYDNDNGRIEKEGSITRGPSSLEHWRWYHRYVNNHIHSEILD